MSSPTPPAGKLPLAGALAGLVLGAAGLALLGALGGARSGDAAAVLGGLGGALLAALGSAGLALALYVMNPGVRRARGARAALWAVGRGAALVVPLAVLALVAELGLEWDCAQVFAPAALASAACAAGGECVRLGGARLRNALVPWAGAMLAALVWAALMFAAAEM